MFVQTPIGWINTRNIARIFINGTVDLYVRYVDGTQQLVETYPSTADAEAAATQLAGLQEVN